MTGFAALQVLLPKLVEQEWNGGVGSYGLLFTLQGSRDGAFRVDRARDGASPTHRRAC